MPETAPSAPEVAVVGPGAVGFVYAVRLAAAGCRVALIDHRPDRAARLSARPLVLEADHGPIEARVPVALAPEAPPEFVLLATKAPQAAEAARAGAAWMGGATVVTLQNGLGVADEVRAALPGAEVLTGVIYQAAHRLGECRVRHVASLGTHLGREGAAPGDAARRLAALLADAGLPATVEDDMRPHVWGKLLVNAAINPVAALVGVRNGEVATRPSLRALAEAVAEEGEAVARAEGVALPYASAAAAAVETARRTADNRCSMLQDLEAGRETEIDYLSGALARRAEAHGLPAPANRALAALVRQASGAVRRE